MAVELVPIATRGDRHAGPIGPGDAPGLFTKELQRALLDGRIDLAVHSLKDLPTDPVAGLSLVAVPPRAPVGDVLISSRYATLAQIPDGGVVGTGSLRRRAQLLAHRPALRVDTIRGNVDTRLRKLEEGQFDAILLAEAGIRRLGLADRIAECLPVAQFLPAVGQGALGVETRTDDCSTSQWVARLDDTASHAAVRAERAMLRTLEGGCLAPIAAWARVVSGKLVLTARVIALDGSRMLEVTDAGRPDDSEGLGHRVAEQLAAQGAVDLIRAARSGW